jgi:hypothetical protein
VKDVRLGTGRRWRHSATHQSEGYILLFTLGVLAVISVLVLSMALSLRLDAQLIGKDKERTQDEYVLRGAVQYALARLNATLEAQRQLAGRPIDALGRRKLWFVEQGSYSFQFAGEELVVYFEDAGILTDANLLTEPEWRILLAELGEVGADAASAYARAIMESKLAIAKQSGFNGFASMQELLQNQSLPQHVVRAVNSKTGMGLKDLLVVGSELKQLDINQSPLVLFKVLAGFGDSQLSNLQLARARGVISQFESQRLMYGSTAKQMTGKSDWLRVRIVFGSDRASQRAPMVVGLLKADSNSYKVVDQLVAEQD